VRDKPQLSAADEHQNANQQMTQRKQHETDWAAAEFKEAL